VTEYVTKFGSLADYDKGNIELINDQKMGRIVLRKGHQALLPANAAYRMSATAPSVILLQTILGDDTVERWADICLS
jgi:hypothetical protein